jgi:hypothetical protein
VVFTAKKIHEYPNYFEINTKLPNGEQLRVKKRFNDNNKIDVLNKMKEIREQNLIHLK